MITVTKNFSVDVDETEYNFVVMKHSKSKEGEPILRPVAYHRTLQAALESIYIKESKKLVKSKDGLDLKETIAELDKLSARLVKVGDKNAKRKTTKTSDSLEGVQG